MEQDIIKKLLTVDSQLQGKSLKLKYLTSYFQSKYALDTYLTPPGLSNTWRMRLTRLPASEKEHFRSVPRARRHVVATASSNSGLVPTSTDPYCFCCRPQAKETETPVARSPDPSGYTCRWPK